MSQKSIGEPTVNTESEAFARLHELTEVKFKTSTQETKQIIFSLAYTLYKRKKRMLLTRYREEAGMSATKINQNINLLLNTEIERDHFLDHATAIASEFVNDVSHRSIVEFEEILNRIIDNKILHKDRTPAQKIVNFLIESAKHAISILVAAGIIAFLWYCLKNYGNFVQDFLYEVWSKYFIKKD